jgi:hypothetical protein
MGENLSQVNRKVFSAFVSVPRLCYKPMQVEAVAPPPVFTYQKTTEVIAKLIETTNLR